MSTEVSIRSVLLVDDDSISNFLTEHTLKESGMQVSIQTALNGQEALQHVEEYCVPQVQPLCPDLILLDLKMPVMDGFEFMRVLQEEHGAILSQIKIVVLTSSDSPREIERAKELGINAYVVKPLSVDKLRWAIKAA